jgi:hypothetical protein
MKGVDLLADPHKIVNMWMNYFCQQVQGVRQTEIQTSESFVPEPNICEVVGKLKRYNSPGADQIPAELIQAGGKRCILRSTNLLS